jgi:hypothetical protein
MFLKSIANRKDYSMIEEMVEPCESTLFSYYINVKGIGFPCSFSEGIYKGVDVLECEDFMNDVWFSDETSKFRKDVLATEQNNICRKCVLYDLGCGRNANSKI